MYTPSVGDIVFGAFLMLLGGIGIVFARSLMQIYLQYLRKEVKRQAAHLPSNAQQAKYAHSQITYLNASISSIEALPKGYIHSVRGIGALFVLLGLGTIFIPSAKPARATQAGPSYEALCAQVQQLTAERDRLRQENEKLRAERQTR
jgi:hypothetical protein